MSQKIVEYFLVSEQSEQVFQERITDYINLGYQPWGSLAINGTKFVQAIVLKEHEPATSRREPQGDRKVPTKHGYPRPKY